MEKNISNKVITANDANTLKQLERLQVELEKDYERKREDLDKQLEKLLKGQNDLLQNKKSEIKKAEKEISELRKIQSDLEVKLNSDKASLTDQLERYKADKLHSLNKELDVQYKNHFTRIDNLSGKIADNIISFIKENETKLTHELNKLVDSYTSLYQSKKELIEQERVTLIKTHENLQNKMKEYADIDAQKEELAYKTRKLELTEKNLEKRIDALVQKRYQELIDELQSEKKLAKEYREKYLELESEYRNILDEYTSSKNLEAIELKKENSQLKKDKAKLVEKYGGFTDSNFVEIQNKAKHADSLQTVFQELQEKYQTLLEESFRLKNEQQSVHSLKFQNDTLEERIKTERLHLSQLKEELSTIESRINNEQEKSTVAESIEDALLDFKDQKVDEDTEKDETQWLNTIQKSCESSGFKFSKRLFYSFHTSLKTSDMSPLTVLAGVSGTGKSKLPQLYSRFGGLYFLSLPVQPDWDSPQSLFGYFNSIEKRFNATSLLRSLVSFQKDKSNSPTSESIYDLSNHVLIVLLDEMNLAHIELYFSDLLSKLEERRGEDKDISFEVDLGAKNGKYHVYLTDNVLWTGTMNEDETTKSLSDKVIDRGNVISFPRPKNFESYNPTKLKPSLGKLKKTVWEKWQSEKAKIQDDLIESYKEHVVKINSYLRKANRALGHRVWQAIEDYMISHPLVIKYSGQKDKLLSALQYAFEEALVHKVVTKLRGIETEGDLRTNCLNPIQNVINTKAPSLSKDFEDALNSITGTFIWDSAEYLNSDYDLE